jgi:hypothetical protein
METIHWSLDHIVKAKSAARKRDLMTSDRNRSMRLKLAIEEMLKDIDMSGEEWNDRDKDGVAYWEKWDKGGRSESDAR